VSLTTQRAILLTSDRLTLLTTRELEAEPDEGLVALPHDVSTVRCPDGITMRANWSPTKAQSEFLNLLRSHASDRRQ
jgi:LysR family transcriptional regulator of gallate degradation